MTLDHGSSQLENLHRWIGILSFSILVLGFLHWFRKRPTPPPDIPEPTGRLDRIFANGNLVLLLLGPWIVCPLLPIALVIAGFVAFTSSHPLARERAWLVLGVDVPLIIVTAYLWIKLVVPSM
jgi:hypothetical protein